MYLSKLQNVFVQIEKMCLSKNYKMYLSELQTIFVEADQVELVGVLLRLNPSARPE